MNRLTFILVADAAALFSATLCADDYPSRPISIVAVFGPGSASDTICRIIADKLSPALGQPIIVEDRPGADGALAAAYVHHQPADGYTLLMGTNSPLSADPFIYRGLGYDPIEDFVPISRVGSFTLMLVVDQNLPIHSIKELVDYAKANPGKPYGTFGNATTSHLYGELLKNVANIDMTHVPYRGSAPLTNDLLANTVMMGFVDLTTASAQIKAGKLRALAVGGEQRRKAMPDVPTMAELGYPGFEIEGWLGVFVPAATPKEIVAKLSEELARIIASPEGVAGLETLSLVPVGGSAETFEKVLRRDYEKWADVVKATGVKGE